MLVLICTASAISGSPPIAQMLGLSGGAALRLLVLGTLVLPLTSILPLHLAFGAASPAGLLLPALRLAGIILLASGGAWIVRRVWLRRAAPRVDEALGGAAALLMAIFVLALMDAVQPALLADPARVAAGLAFLCVVSFALQFAAALLHLRFGPPPGDGRRSGAVGVVAGNRNIALFLAALPAAQIDPLMLLVGLYQVPMYLTPIVLRGLYARIAARRDGG